MYSKPGECVPWQSTHKNNNKILHKMHVLQQIDTFMNLPRILKHFQPIFYISVYPGNTEKNYCQKHHFSNTIFSHCEKLVECFERVGSPRTILLKNQTVKKKTQEKTFKKLNISTEI